MIFLPAPALAANVAVAAPEPADADEAAPEDMAADVIADEFADVIADVEPAAALLEPAAALLEPAAADVDGAGEAELLAADPELLLLQAARVRAAAAVMIVAATRVLAFIGVLLDSGESGIDRRRRTDNSGSRPGFIAELAAQMGMKWGGKEVGVR